MPIAIPINNVHANGAINIPIKIPNTSRTPTKGNIESPPKKARFITGLRNTFYAGHVFSFNSPVFGSINPIFMASKKYICPQF